MSWNIRTAELDDLDGFGGHAWDSRRDTVIESIRRHEPDVLSIQETSERQATDLRRGLPEYDWVGLDRGRDADGSGERCPIGYRPKRFLIEDTGRFWLSERPDVPGSVGWDADCPRMVVWAELSERRSNHRFVCLNVHFDHVGRRAREESARLLLSRLEDVGSESETPLVVLGDINCDETEEPYRILKSGGDAGGGLEDARDLAIERHGPESTRTDFRSLIEDRYDYVFVSGASVHRYETCACRSADGYPSDHLPVIASIEIGRPA